MSRWLVWCVKFYQKNRYRQQPVCCFIPTCSDYAIKALSKYGIFCGGLKVLGRLLRCQPLWCRSFQVDEP